MSTRFVLPPLRLELPLMEVSLVAKSNSESKFRGLLGVASYSCVTFRINWYWGRLPNRSRITYTPVLLRGHSISARGIQSSKSIVSSYSGDDALLRLFCQQLKQETSGNMLLSLTAYQFPN